MKKAAMNRKKRLDAPSKQESRERYESARRQNSNEDAKDDLLSSTSELAKRPREDSNQDIEAQSSDLRGKIPKFSRTIAGNVEKGSLVVNVGKNDSSSTLSLVDPSYDDTRMPVEKFNYSHKRSDADLVEDDDDDDLRSLIERQRKTDKHSEVSKKDDKNPKKSGSTFYDSKFDYTKEHPKSKTSDNYRDNKRKDSKDNKSASGKSDRHSKHDAKSKTSKGKDQSKSSYELGFPFFANEDKPAEEMDINETLKELAYLRSIQTGDNALPKEEEEYFRKLNDLSKPNLASQFDLLTAGVTSSEKTDAGRKASSETLSKMESKWDSVIDKMVGKKTVGNPTNDDDMAYGPSLPPKKSSVTSKKAQGSTSTEKIYSRERSLSNSKSDHMTSPIAVRGGFRGRGFRGRGMRGSFRGRGRGRGAQDFALAFRGRGRGRSRGRFIRGGFIPSRGRHIFAKGGATSRKSRSRSRSSSRGRSRSSSYSRSRSRSRSRGRSNKRRRSSSRSSYSSSSYSRSRSRSRDRSRGRKQTKRRSRSRSYSSSSRSRSRSRRRSRSRSTSHSRSRKRSRSVSRSRGSYKKQSKDRERSRSRSRSKSSSRSRSRKRKDRSRSWSFDEDYTKKKGTSGAKTTAAKTPAKKEQETKTQPRPKKEKTQTMMAKPKNKDKPREPKLEQTNQAKGKTREKIPGSVPEHPHEKPKGENFNSPAVVALKDLKVTAYSNVFLPRTVSKNVGNISKGMSITKGRMLPLKKHPLFDAQEEEPQEEPEKIDPKELERMKEEKQKFDSEVDKVFNAKSGVDADRRGSWKRVWPPEESPKNEETRENKESVETKYEEIEEEIFVVEDQRIVETKDATEEKKTEKEQKKERKEKRKKEKEEKMKRKKEKKEKREKKIKESTTQENLGNENREKVLGDDGQVVVDSSKPEQYNQEGYSEYSEYPEGEYQYYEETGQEQGWYDENGVYHPYEEEYLYYYDQEGNIVGYEGPEGYVEGNPFEEQQYYYEGEQQQEGVQPDVYGQEPFTTEYTGEAEGYHYPVEGQAVEEPQYEGTDSNWQEYAADAPEQQWYAAEGSYPEGGEGYTEYHYVENQEGNHFPEAQLPVQQDPNYMLPQQDSSQTFTAAPAQAGEEPKSEDLNENELVLALGKNLAALARLKGWDQKEILGQDPLSIVQMLQKPAVETPAVPAQEEPLRRPVEQDRPLEEPHRELQEKPEVPKQHRYNTRQKDKTRMQNTRERSPIISESRAAEEKPLKSILKKRNSTSLKPPIKPETTANPLLQKDPSAATSDHVGPEYIVRISKSGAERFFCKLCQCHIESPMAKELHVKSMKHIELFVREKSSLLHSVIGAKVPEDAEVSSQQDKLTEGSPQRSRDKIDESSDTAEEEATRNRLLDYDRLRLMDWQRREGSVGSVESEKLKHLDYGRVEDQDLERRTSRKDIEHERYEDRSDPSRWPRETREDWRKHEESYRRELQRYAAEHRERDYEKGDYHRERRSLSHDSDRQDDRRSIGSRSSDRSYDDSKKDSRSEHQSQPTAYRNRMPQDARNSPRGRSQGESSQRASKEQVPVLSRSEKSRETLNQNERGRSRGDGDTGNEKREKTNAPPQENSGQTPQDSRPGHGQASRESIRQNSNRKAQETSSLSSSSSRTPSSERKEMPRAEDTGRRADENVKSSKKMNQSSPTVARNQSQKTSRDSGSNRNTGAAPKDGTPMTTKSYPERAGIKPLPSIQSQKEPTNQQAPSSNVKPLAGLLGDPPKSHTQDQKPQEQAKSITTVIQGQRRVPPPPPPYNKGSGPQSFRGRGGQGHAPLHVGRGGHQSHFAPSQPGLMGESLRAHTRLPMAPQAPSYKVAAPTPVPVPSSHMPPRQFPGDQAMGGHLTPPFYGRGRAVGQPQFRGRGGGPHMARGGGPHMAQGSHHMAQGGPHMAQGSPHMAQRGSYGAPPQFASRGRGGRGYHGQRW